MDNKNIFAKNLQRLMDENNKSRKDVCEALGFSYFTYTDWVKGKKYPRMDKVEKLANYFGVLKSDLIEEKTEEHRKTQQKNDTLSSITIKLMENDNFLSVVKKLYSLDDTQLKSVSALLDAFSSTTEK